MTAQPSAEQQQRLHRHLARLRNPKFLEAQLHRPSEAEYWQQQEEQEHHHHWGVLELDQGDKKRLLGQCVVWGLPSLACATFVAHTATFLLDEERRQHITYVAIPRLSLKGITVGIGPTLVVHLTPDRLPLGNVRNWLHDLRGRLYEHLKLEHVQWHEKMRVTICKQVAHRTDLFLCESGNSRRMALARKSWACHAMRLVRKHNMHGTPTAAASATEEEDEEREGEGEEKDIPLVGSEAAWETYVRPCLATLMETAAKALSLFQEQWRVLGQVAQQHDLVSWQLPQSLAREHDPAVLLGPAKAGAAATTTATQKKKKRPKKTTLEDDEDSMIVDASSLEKDADSFSPDDNDDDNEESEESASDDSGSEEEEDDADEDDEEEEEEEEMSESSEMDVDSSDSD